MDAQFWFSLASFVFNAGLSIYIAYMTHQQVAIMQQQSQPPTRGKKKAPITRLLWGIPAKFYAPLLGALIFSLTAWIPYLLSHEWNPIRTSVRQSMEAFVMDSPDQIPGRSTGRTEMNLGIKNFGPLPAKETSIKAKIFWSPVLSKTDEDDQWNDFQRTAVESNPSDIDVTGQRWQTYSSNPLTERDLAEIKEGRLFLYEFFVWAYSDNGGSHKTEACHYLQTPVDARAGPIWHDCNRKMTIR